MITKTELDRLVKEYETEDFIKDDPVRFPNRFTEKKILKLRVLLHRLLHMAEEMFLSKNLIHFLNLHKMNL